MINTISEITKLWDQSLIKIEERLGSENKQLFDAFFSDSYIYEFRGDKIVVVVNSTLAKSLLSQKYYEIIADSVHELTESNFKIEFIEEKEIEHVPSPVEPQVKKQTYFKDSAINSNLTFENFVVGHFNREASQAALYVASNPGKTFAQPLFLFSKSGLGKTHLMHAIGNYIHNAHHDYKILYIPANDFVEEYVRFVRGENEAESLKDFVTNYDVLLLDDIQLLKDKVKTQELLFAIYDKMISLNKQIVITSDRQPNELNGLADRLVTRFNKGLSVQINEPDQNTCVEILKKKIQANGLDLERFDESVLYFLADKFSNDIRELEGSLNRLMFKVVSVKQTDRITMDVAADIMSSLSGGKNIASQLNEQKIINIVADYYNLTPSQLTGKIRTGQISLARHIAMYLIRNTLDIPLKKIGDMFGGKDHTTVMSGIQKVDRELKTDEKIKEAVSELEKRIKA